MSVVYLNGQPVNIQAGTLAKILEDITDNMSGSRRITLDFEASGLFVDGYWSAQASKCQPKARVSSAGIAWRDASGCLNTLGMAFDQGMIGGKPGKWNAAANDFDTLPHIADCLSLREDCTCGNSGYGIDGDACSDCGGQAVYIGTCTCGPWNLNVQDWQYFMQWVSQFNIVYHNAKYDMHIANAGMRGHEDTTGCNLVNRLVWDTILVQGLLEPLHSPALKKTAIRLWGEEQGDEQAAQAQALKANGAGLTRRYDLCDWSVTGPYVAKDAELTFKLAEHQYQLIENGFVEATDIDLIDKDLELCKLLFKMENRRVGLNVEAMRVEAEKLLALKDELESRLPFHPASLPAAKRYFFGPVEGGGLNLLPIKVSNVCGACSYNRVKGMQRTNSKKEVCPNNNHSWQVSLDTEVVDALVKANQPGAAQWKQLANVDSALNKWYKAWPNKAVNTPQGWRIMTNFRQGRVESEKKGQTSGGAISGRLSAERVQLHGVPKDYRIPEGIKGVKKLLSVKPGYQGWELDQSNAEIRVAAWLTGDKALIEKVNSGANIHDENTRAIFNVDPDHPRWNEFRDLCKIGVFSDMYGAGVDQMVAQGLGNHTTVRDFKARLNQAYPGLRRTARGCQQKADKSRGGCGYVRLVNGRKRWFGWAEKTHKAFNACMQGGVAEAMKVWMITVESTYPGMLINQVHDSLWLEIPNDMVDNVTDSVAHMGVSIFEDLFHTNSYKIKFLVDKKRFA